MQPRRLPVLLSAAALALLTLLAALFAMDGRADGVARAAEAPARAAWPMAAPSAMPQAFAVVTPTAPARQAATAAAAVNLKVVAPPKLLVGETSELVVSVGPNAGIGEIAFTVQFDANLLQVRAGSDGNWAAGSGTPARFAAEIAGTEDRVSIRSAVNGHHAASGIVAIVEFQAVAPGHTAVLVSDVTVKDAAGRALAFALSASNLPVTVESPPPTTP